MTDRSTLHGRHTVKKLAALSGVSIRALHHYHDIGLLKPASVGSNGYRYYGREELLRLQQILFHKELGFSLESIREALDAPDFDRTTALRDQREKLAAETRRLRQLLRTIDDTLTELEGGKAMSEKKMYRGFAPGALERGQAWAIERYGEWARLGIEARSKAVSGWSEDDHRRHGIEWSQILDDFATSLLEGKAPGASRTQDIARRLHDHASKAWTGPVSRGGFLNLSDVYAENPEFRSVLDDRLTGLSDFVARAMRIFAVETEPWPHAERAAA
jgi:DNA-binding transcriptional MerR regulator